jgi:hypothetical protein
VTTGPARPIDCARRYSSAVPTPACFVFPVLAGVAALIAIAMRHRHGMAIACGAAVAAHVSLIGAIGIAWLVQRDDATVARVFLVLVVNTGAAFFFGVTAMFVAARRPRA